MLLPLLLGLGSGLCWGVADFVGGLQARRLPALAVAFWSQVAGAAALAVALQFAGAPASWAVLAWGAIAGIFGGGGLLFFYRGLAIGPMSIVAPVAACGAAVPVVTAFLLGQPPGPVALGGIAAAMLGTLLVSTPTSATDDAVGRPTAALGVALGAALCFGLFFSFLHRGTAAGGPELWVVGAARAGSVAAIGLVALVGRRRLPWPGQRASTVAAVGLIDTTANVLFTYAATLGNLGVVSVLGSLYPVATVLLARLVLSERLSRPQSAGVAVALTGVALMAAA